jgi:prepilin-type processing-associated H-X9-DG protein
VVNPVSFSYYDLATTATHSGMYQQMMVLARYAGFGDLFGVPLPEPLLPPLDVLAEHLAPAGAFAWVDEAGYHVKSVSPFPGSKMFSEAGMMSTAGVGGTALGISILLPSLNRARETANRVKCAANLKQMGLGMMLYANENRGRFPQTLGDLARTREVPLDAFVCPSSDNSLPELARAAIDVQAAWVNENSDYVYLGAGKTQAVGAEVILIHEKPDNHSREGVNVLYGDGHVEFLRMDELQRALQRQAPAGAR